MTGRLGFLCALFALTIVFAGDGIPVRGSAEDYPAHQAAGKIAIGAAYVSPAQVKKIFGEDLDKRGWEVFEVGISPPAPMRPLCPLTISSCGRAKMPLSRDQRLLTW